jgi:Hemerythrin HHE cation binding domain/Polyketide cyclase / dehydrase and lipid transport
MTDLRDAPVDTRMMGIVHDALRRDLARAIATLSAAPYPDGARRVALGEHLRWMMSFLHAHHHGEDAGLWPLVRERDPRAVPLADAMEADHALVDPLVDACATAARRYADSASDEARCALLASLRDLAEVLLPHLQREEDEMMPLVSIAITSAEWHAVDQQYYLAPKSLAELGFEGHWLLDGLDPERSQVVVHQVPPVQRVVLVRGFAGRYRRRATACWGAASASPGSTYSKAYGPAATSPRTIPRTGLVETVVAAPIDAVWEVVSDVTRVGEWSHECRRVEWLDGATGAVPGARFRGTNKAGGWTWSRTNEVVVTDEPRTLVWRTVPTLLFPDSSEWRIELEPADGGTRITQSYKVVRAPALLAHLYAVIVPSHRDRRAGLSDDLRRLGELAQGTRRRGTVSTAPQRH